jgi:hypothetical protein
MARHRTWDSEAYTPYFEDDDPSLYRPSIWRRVLMIGIVVFPIVAAALLIYAFIRVYIIPPTVAVAPMTIGPTSIASREPFVPLSVVSRSDPAAPPDTSPQVAPQPTAPTRSAARSLPEPRREPPQAGTPPASLPWPGPTIPSAREAPPPLPPEITAGPTATPAPPEIIPLPRRRPRQTAAAAADATSTRSPARSATAADAAPPAPADPISSTSYGSPN